MALKQLQQELSNTVYSRADTVRVVVAGHPLRATKIEVHLLAGLSIAEIVEQAAIETHISDLATTVVAYIDGHVVEAKNWSRVRPKAGTIIVLRAVAEGPLVAAVGAVFSAISAAAASASAFLGGLGVFGKVIGAGLALGAKFLLNALFPIRPPSLSNEPDERGKSAFSISGSRNSADPFGTVPVVFGQHRVTPNYGALPYTENHNDDQFFRGLFVWCYAPAELSDIRIGETPLSSFDGYEIQHTAGGDTLPLFSSQVVEEPLSIELENSLGWVTRTTAPDVTEISADIVFPNGIYGLDKKTGKKFAYTVWLECHYRKVGAPSWTVHPPMQVALRTVDPVRRTFRAAVPEGQYEIRIRRATQEDEAVETANWSAFSKTALTAIRGARPRAPISFSKPLLTTAIRIRASQQLNGSLDNLNGVVTAYVYRAFNGTDWVANQPSRNPADILLHILQGPANARPVPDNQIDWPTITAFWRYCHSRGYTYDAVITSPRSVFDMVADVCAAGRAVPLFRDGKWSTVWDEAETPIVQQFTPRNSWGFESEKTFIKLPHAFKVRFINREKGYVEDERIVYDDGFHAGNATIFETIEFNGVTDPTNVWKFGRFHLAQLKLRPEKITLNTDWENLICTRGDRVRVMHDVMLIGQAAGRVMGYENGHLLLDETVSVEAGRNYTFRWRTHQFGDLSKVISGLPVGEYRRIPWTGDIPQRDELFTWGEAGVETAVYRVLSIESNEDFTARLTLVDDAPEISRADQGAIPAFQSNVTRPVDPYSVPPTEFRISQEAYELGGFWYASMHLTWSGARTARVSRFEVAMMDTEVGAWKSLGSTPPSQTSLTVNDLDEGLYRFRVRCIFNDGTFSSWLESEAISTTALLDAPDQVENFNIAVLDAVSILTWNAVPNASFYEIRFSPDEQETVWNNANPIVPRASGSNVQVPTLAGSYMIKSVKGNGIRSRLATVIRTNVGALLNHNVIEVLKEEGFPGSLNGTQKSDNFIRLETKRVSTPQGDVNYAVPEGFYTFSKTVDMGTVYTSRMTGTIKAEGSDLTNVMSSWTSLAALPFLDNSSPDDWGVELQYRSTEAAPSAGNWTPWKPLIVGDVVARALQFRLRLHGVSIRGADYSTVTPIVSGVSVSIDMPDRIAAGDNIPVSAEGRRISYDQGFAAVPAIAVSGQNIAATDNYIITNKTSSGFFIRFYNASNTPVAATFDYVAKGYGVAA